MHTIVYGAALTVNSRGGALVEFLNSLNLEILDQGNEPIFCSAGRLEVIDIAKGSFGLLESIINWEVSSEPSLLDHRHSVHFTGLRNGAPNQEP